MYSKELYHGTEINRGNRMILARKMEISRGDNHWLGDGSYFYEDEFYAFKWIKDMYRSHFKREYSNIDDLLKNYRIIEANINVDNRRIFNLDSPINKIEFDSVYIKCESLKKYSERFNSVKLAEGVVLNIMFNEIGYGENYDLVIATFGMRRDKYKNEKLRLNFMPEKQYCIKNLDIVEISGFKEFTEKDINTYIEIINKLNFKENKENYNKYKDNRKNKKVIHNFFNNKNMIKNQTK